MRAHYGEHFVRCLGCGLKVKLLLLKKHAERGTYHNPGCLKRMITPEQAQRLIERVEAEEAQGGGYGEAA